MKNVVIALALLGIAACAALVRFWQTDSKPLVKRDDPPASQEEAPETGSAATRRRKKSGSSGGASNSVGGVSAELFRLLAEFGQTISPKRARQIAMTIGRQIERMRPAMIGIFDSRGPDGEDHVLVGEAIDVAGIIGDQKLRPHLVDLAQTSESARVMADAFRAASTLEPWTRFELEQFLGSGSKPVILAVLGTTPDRRNDVPTTAIIELLEQDDEEIQDAAIQALPSSLPSNDRRTLFRNLDHGSSALRRASLRALCRGRIDEEMERVLTESVKSADRKTRLLALGLLSQKPGRVLEPEKIWSPSSSKTLDETELALALHCLERTRSANLQHVKAQVATMPPLGRYFAARCCIAQADKAGIRLLLDLLDDLEADQDPDHEAVLIDVRDLLGRLSGTGQFAGAERWREWFKGLDSIAKRDLGPHGLELR